MVRCKPSSKLAGMLSHLESLRGQLKQQGGDLYEKRTYWYSVQNELLLLISAKRGELTETLDY